MGTWTSGTGEHPERGLNHSFPHGFGVRDRQRMIYSHVFRGNGACGCADLQQSSFSPARPAVQRLVLPPRSRGRCDGAKRVRESPDAGALCSRSSSQCRPGAVCLGFMEENSELMTEWHRQDSKNLRFGLRSPAVKWFSICEEACSLRNKGQL